MNYPITSFHVSPALGMATTLAIAAVFLASVPAFAQAASYAYVNQSGEVRMVTAATPNEALATAPLIAEHSGVLLLQSQTDNEIVGDQVIGI